MATCRLTTAVWICPTLINIAVCGARNALALINVVALRRARLVLRWVTVGIPSWYLTKPTRAPTQPAHPSTWVDAMSTGDGIDHRQGRNDEFCVTVGLVTRTVGIRVVLWLKPVKERLRHEEDFYS